MPEIVKVFAKGRMNKDLDERMVPNGEYRDALNLDLSVSEGSDVGAFENIKGNKEIIHKSYNASTLSFKDWDSDYISNLTNAACVGAIKDEETEKIYWFISSTEVNAIAEYDQTIDVVKPLLVEKKTVSNFLNFTSDNIITGINILKGILFWTDNKTEPKKIIIEDWQNSTVNFLIHSKIYGRNFIEQDVTVIKKYPLAAPDLLMRRTKRAGNIKGNISYRFASIDSDGDQTQLDSSSPEQTFGFSSKMDYKVGDVLLFSLIDDAAEYNEDFEVRVLVTGVTSPYLIKGRIQSISNDMPAGTLPWEVELLLDDPLFEFKFPRFAYRYKYKDNQYSVFSPFTQTAFLPGASFEYDTKNAYNEAMVNTARVIELSNFVTSNIPPDVIAIDLLYKETGNNAVYKVDTVEKDSKKWNDNLYTIESEIISSIVEANQILRPFDNIPKQALAQEIVANRLIYGNYKQNYSMLTLTGQPVKPIFGFGIAEAKVLNEDGTYSSPELPYPSIKSQRTYQLGIVYIDEYGRQSPVFTSDTATKILNKSFSGIATNVTNKMLSTPPSWAKYFKYFIKENASEYYNLAMDRVYDAADGNVWVSFPSADRDKINEQTFIELKKEHDNQEAVTDAAKYKVISISNNAPAFLKLSKKSLGSIEHNFASGMIDSENSFPLVDRVSFRLNGAAFDTAPFGNLATTGVNNNYVRIGSTGNLSNYFEITSVKRIEGDASAFDYEIYLAKKFDDSVDFTSADGTFANRTSDTLNVEFFKEESESKSEYEGRFFVKLNRDSILEDKLLNSKATEDFVTVYKQDLGWTSTKFGPADWHFNTYGTGNGKTEIWENGVGTGTTYNDRRGNGASQGSKKITLSIRGKDGKGNNARGWEDQRWLWRTFGSYGETTQYQTFINAIDAPGTRFRFTDDPTTPKPIYEIIKSTRVHAAIEDRSQHKEGKFESERTKIFQLELDKPLVWSPLSVLTRNDRNSKTAIEIIKPYIEDGDTFRSDNPAIWETEPKETVDLDLYYAASDVFPIAEHDQVKELNWHNCWAFGNGVESNRIRDDFAATYLDNNPIVSTVLEEPYEEEHRSTGLIFSQIFNSRSGVNNLNQFILAEAITKDLNPRHGSIQKLYARDTDMVTLCEDKCFYILANKDALFNADGSANLTSNSAVLGLARPYAGDYGISTNPESFAAYGNKIYFTDKNRGVVIRLSGGLGGGDGITLISGKGMADYFEDNLQLNNKLVGSYDTTSGAYNLVLNNVGSTLSYQESVDGWVSRLSFLKEQGLSINNKYYTFDSGRIWEHKANSLYNNFYGVQYESHFTVLLNDQPTSVKNFKTLNYTGSEARDYKYLTGNGIKYSLAEIQAKGLTPTSQSIEPGWWTDSINTDLQEGQLKTFLNKEGKYFNYIKGIATTLSNVDSQEFSVQGIGTATVTGDERTEFNVHVYIADNCFVGNYKVHVFVDDTCYINN